MSLADPRLFAGRLIVLDTETTGLDPKSGDRVVEIGCVELIGCVPSGNEFHCYINPLRDMPAGAEAIHGLSAAFLAQHPCFAEHAARLIAFLGDAPLIAHNAPFDIGFLDHEFARCGHPPLTMTRAIDTIMLARARLPGAKHSLDALCIRYGIDRAARVKHGALVDARLLAEVYIELIGGRQIGLSLGIAPALRAGDLSAPAAAAPRPFHPPRPHAPSPEETDRHRTFVSRLTDPLWRLLEDEPI